MIMKLPCNATINKDGDQMFILIGDNIQEGLAGFGPTLADALRDLAYTVENSEIEVVP